MHEESKEEIQMQPKVTQKKTMWQCPECACVRKLKEECSCGFTIKDYDDIEDLLLEVPVKFQEKKQDKNRNNARNVYQSQQIP